MNFENKEKTLEMVEKQIEEDQIEFIRFEFGDMSGFSRCKVVPARHVRAKSTRGVNIPLVHLAMDPSCHFAQGTGYSTEIGWGDAAFLPDLSTFRTVPWCKNTALVLTEPCFQGKPVSSYPRYIARQQIDRLNEMGLSLLSAHEHEFYVIGAESKKPLHAGNLRSSLSIFAESDLLYEFSRCLQMTGVDVEAIDTEVSPGQVEITYKPAFGIRAADNAHIYRTAIKEIAQKRGYIASFMSKPWSDQSGSSAHFCHSLWDTEGKTSLMHDPSMELGISELAEHWIAGIIAHAPAISLLMAPTTNCQKRTEPNSFAPTNGTWGIDNRTCALRLKSQGENGMYLENRMGASASNPYLTLAATVAAGIDGIKRSLPLPPRVTRDAYNNEDVPPGTKALPSNLKDAVDAFQGDIVVREAFGEEFCRAFLAIKRLELEIEQESSETGKPLWEYNSYFVMT
ncbi:lengsin-like [Asterias rubens]|uniref:lengsin-like n=1 Tax=Asterias rubens TaxID=7604 RepID=UPI0014552C26|nr:lengsin-like [Asterias rubens]